jgi:hypothetical protein
LSSEPPAAVVAAGREGETMVHAQWLHDVPSFSKEGWVAMLSMEWCKVEVGRVHEERG